MIAFPAIEHHPGKILQKSACEIFHDEAVLKFSNPQLVWLIGQAVSSDVIFYSEAIQQNLFGLRIFCRHFRGESERAASFANRGWRFDWRNFDSGKFSCSGGRNRSIRRADNFQCLGTAGDELNDLHLDRGGDYFDCRARQHLEKHQGDPIGNAKCDRSDG